MDSFKLLQIFILLPCLAAGKAAAIHLVLWSYKCIDAYGNYTSNSTFKSNLDTVLTNMSTTDISYGFYNFSAGRDSDQAYAIAVCRGDVDVADCHTCLDFVKPRLAGLCPSQKEVIGWTDNCMIRYSSRDILGGVCESDPTFTLVSGRHVAEVDHFTVVLQNLLGSLQNRTASGNSSLKFATGGANVTVNQSVYALTQCTPDLSKIDCLGCLNGSLIRLFLQVDRGQTGARVLMPSCFARYESWKFYSPSDPVPSSPTSSSTGKGSGKSKTIIIVVVCVVACLVALLVISLWYWLGRRTELTIQLGGVHEANNNNNNLSPSLAKEGLGCVHEANNNNNHNLSHSEEGLGGRDVDEASRIKLLQLDLSIIKDATGNFSDDNFLGSGGYGCVYKGVRTNGQKIAVKRLSEKSNQGEKEFMNEVMLISLVAHKNLVRLLGFCNEDDEKLLIYEFVPNGSLDHILFDPTRRAQLLWEKRHRIISDIACGLLYLHKDARFCIIHRDIKASNVLLDAEMMPKIADFGLARRFQADQTHTNTLHVAGTIGYIAPEYANEGSISVKADVYSFGVLVLEIVAGKRNWVSPNCETLVHMARRSWCNGTPLDIVDPTTAAAGSQFEMRKCIYIGLYCVIESEEKRPTMSSVVNMLSPESNFQVPSQPPEEFLTSIMPPIADDERSVLAGSSESDPPSTRFITCSCCVKL